MQTGLIIGTRTTCWAPTGIDSRSCLDEEFLSVDMLPTPRKIVAKVSAPKAVLEPKCLSSSRQVDIGDQIAIRSYVLGKTL